MTVPEGNDIMSTADAPGACQAGADHMRRPGGDRAGFASDQPRESDLTGFPFRTHRVQVASLAPFRPDLRARREG